MMRVTLTLIDVPPFRRPDGVVRIVTSTLAKEQIIAAARAVAAP